MLHISQGVSHGAITKCNKGERMGAKGNVIELDLTMLEKALLCYKNEGKVIVKRNKRKSMFMRVIEGKWV
jgi:hypothetical protein